MRQIGDGDTVVLLLDKPGVDLKKGALGTVWAIYSTDPTSYEVTFTDSKGVVFDYHALNEDVALATQKDIDKARQKSDKWY